MTKPACTSAGSVDHSRSVMKLIMVKIIFQVICNIHLPISMKLYKISILLSFPEGFRMAEIYVVIIPFLLVVKIGKSVANIWQNSGEIL